MTWKKYCVMLLNLSLFVLVIHVAAAEWMLHRLNETYVGDTAAIDLQLRENALYGSALTDDIGFLKYGIISRTKPDIIALGTSRSMQFRAPFFKDASFYTVGGLGRSVDAMNAVFDRISSYYTPKIVILAVDWFWLNPKHPHDKRTFMFEEDHIFSNKTYLYSCLYHELWQNERIQGQLIHPEIKTRDLVGNHPTIGLMAGGKSDGFRSDGSYQYGRFILYPHSYEERIGDIRRRIQNGGEKYETAYHVDKAEKEKLSALIHKMQEGGSHVIVVLPPFPNEIYQTFMESDGHRDFMLQFEHCVGEICAERDAPFYDFSNMAWLGAPDDEAVDGIHAGEKTYGRIVLQFESDPIIAPYINKAFIEQCMEQSRHPLQLIPADM